MNTICAYGRVASDVTTNDVNGRTVAKFRFASNNKRKQQDGSYGTNFYNVSVWGPSGENCAKFLKKGHRATVSGELVIRQYVGNDGMNHQSVEIDANSVDFVETKSEADAKSGNASNSSAEYGKNVTAQASAPAPAGFTPVETDELPF